MKILVRHSIASKLFIYTLGSAFVGIGSLSYGFYRLLEKQTVETLQRSLAGHVTALEDQLAEGQQMAQTISRAAIALNQQGIDNHRDYRSYLERQTHHTPLVLIQRPAKRYPILIHFLIVHL